MIPLKQVSKIDGLSLGSEGTLSLTEFDKIVEIPDGRRKLLPIAMELRVDSSLMFRVVENFFMDWWAKRRRVTHTIMVDICNRAYLPYYTWYFYHCSIQDLAMPGMELGNGRLATFTTSFQPYDVMIKRLV
jgi:hypothetical protein